MALASAHPSASLAVPSTQNTAPVFEFRCLYSNDLRRKSKRWQDGILRFHTFNKRVMVYDIPRNYIGDTHWREDDPVRDGDELQLDKGILIQVGEVLGSVQQDLTSLLERRKPPREVSPTTVTSPRSMAARSAAAPLSQLRPKSLNALLGNPQGNYGRCSLPAKSPFEQRHRNELENWAIDAPAKRRRIGEVNTGFELQGLAAAPIPPKNKRLAYPPTVAPLRHSLNKVHAKPPAAMDEAIFIESDDEEVTTQHHPSNPEKSGTQRGQSRESSYQTSPGLASSVDVNLPLEAKEDSRLSRLTGSRPCVTYSSEKLTTTVAPSLPDDSSEKRVNPLRFASNKPRKKLMYKDLLPSRPPSINSVRVAGQDLGIENEQASSKSRKILSVEPEDDLGQFHKAQEGRLKARLGDTRPQGKRDLERVLYSPRDSIDVNSTEFQERHVTTPHRNRLGTPALDLDAIEFGLQSSLFVSTQSSTRSRRKSLSGAQVPISEDVWPSCNKNACRELARMDQILLVHPRRTVSEPTRSSTNSKSKSPTGANYSTTTPKSSEDIVEIAPRAETLLQEPKETLLNRQLSHNQIIQPRRSKPLTSFPSIPHKSRSRSPLKKSFSENTKGESNPAVSKKTIGKAVSDLSGLYSAPKKTDIENQRADQDIGPWSRESFDLFGWTPKDKDSNGKKAQEDIGSRGIGSFDIYA